MAKRSAWGNTVDSDTPRDQLLSGGGVISGSFVLIFTTQFISCLPFFGVSIG